MPKIAVRAELHLSFEFDDFTDRIIYTETTASGTAPASGTLRSGGGYKITQTNGNLCGGPCPRDPSDMYPYYWLYDLNEILSASHPWNVLPYEYGEWDDRFPMGLPTSASFDPVSGKLFVLTESATAPDRGGYPVINVYQISPDISEPEVTAAPNPPGSFSVSISN